MTPVASADTAGISVSKQPLSPEELRKMKDRKSTRLNSSHLVISYAVFCLKKKKKTQQITIVYTPHKQHHSCAFKTTLSNVLVPRHGRPKYNRQHVTLTWLTQACASTSASL